MSNRCWTRVSQLINFNIMYWKYIFTRTIFIIHDIYKSCQSHTLLHTYKNLLINIIIEV